MADADFGAMKAELDVSTPAIFDSGATHHLTGAIQLLHSFRLLKSPIALNVATSGVGAYISGAGKLHFRGPRGTTITISGVLFCEQASSTLVSLAALQKANWSFQYDTPSDTFDIFDTNGVSIFRCPFE